MKAKFLTRSIESLGEKWQRRIFLPQPAGKEFRTSLRQQALFCRCFDSRRWRLAAALHFMRDRKLKSKYLLAQHWDLPQGEVVFRSKNLVRQQRAAEICFTYTNTGPAVWGYCSKTFFYSFTLYVSKEETLRQHRKSADLLCSDLHSFSIPHAAFYQLGLETRERGERERRRKKSAPKKEKN